MLQGPTETAYEGGSFHLAITVPEQYPLVPPTVKYKTKIFHPNVHFKVRERKGRRWAYVLTSQAAHMKPIYNNNAASHLNFNCHYL